MKYRVGIYLRLSNEDRDKAQKSDDSESIKNQRNMLMDYINKHDDFILYDEYIDEDLSGAGTFRPEFERLIRDCENRVIDIVLCKSQSRFSRDMEIVEKYINNKFIEWNIRFIGLCDNADSNIIGNKKSRQINGLVNEWYLEDLSNNIRGAFNSKMKMGELISPFASFGYEIDKCNNNKLVIDPVASIIVKKIFNLYLNGYGISKIANILNELDFPSPSLYKYRKGIKLNIVSNKNREDIKWSSNAIKVILTNELYIGNLIQGKRTTVSYKNHKVIKRDKCFWIRRENTHESIINKNDFYKVQKIMKERAKPMKVSGLVHIFSGKVFCLECNSYMRKKNSKKHEYLVCSSIYDGCINKSSIRYDELESIILLNINKLINKYFDFKILDDELKKINNIENNIELFVKEKENIFNKLKKYDNYLKNIYEDKVDNVITLDQFKELVNVYTNEKNKLNIELKYINDEIDNKPLKENNNLIYKYMNFNKLNRVIVEEFIDKIYIGKIDKDNNRDIFIKWNF